MNVPDRMPEESSAVASHLPTYLGFLAVCMAPVFGKKKKKHEEEDTGGTGISPDRLEENFARPKEMPLIKMPDDIPPPPPAADAQEEDIPQLSAPPTFTSIASRGTWNCPACSTNVNEKIYFCTYCGQPKPDLDPNKPTSSALPIPKYETPLSIMKDYSDAKDDPSIVAPTPFPKRPTPDAKPPVRKKLKRASTSWKCPKCKRTMNAKYKFCTNCGFKNG